MLKGLDNGLVEACSMFFNFGAFVRSHKKLGCLYADRDLINRLVSLLRKFAEVDRGLKSISLMTQLDQSRTIPAE